jgi:hypothetical protein
MRVNRRRAQTQVPRQSAEEIESAIRVCAWCSMRSSNTPSDLKSDRVTRDATYVNAADENSNDCLSRSFADIKKLPTILVAMCCFGHTAMCKQRHTWLPIEIHLFSTAHPVNCLGRAAKTGSISATSHIRLNSSRKFYAAATREISGTN